MHMHRLHPQTVESSLEKEVVVQREESAEEPKT